MNIQKLKKHTCGTPTPETSNMHRGRFKCLLPLAYTPFSASSTLLPSCSGAASVSLRGWGCEIIHPQNKKSSAQIPHIRASTFENRTHKKPIPDSEPEPILSEQLAGGDTMICPVCKFNGQPHEERRNVETLHSCSQCGVLLKAEPTVTRAKPQDLQTFLEALQNAA